MKHWVANPVSHPDCARGSHTQRIQQRCTNFKVDKVRTGLARIALDESALPGIAPQQLAYSREVFLYACNQPVVFAHPLAERKPLHYKALRNMHPQYQRAAAVLNPDRPLEAFLIVGASLPTKAGFQQAR